MSAKKSHHVSFCPSGELPWYKNTAPDDNFIEVSDKLPLHPTITPVLFSIYLIAFFIAEQMRWLEVTLATAMLINTKIFQLWSHISMLLLNRSLARAFHISFSACKIIPKFPLLHWG